MTDCQHAPGPYVGVKIKRPRVAGMLLELLPYLKPGESVLALAVTASLRPLLSHVVVTSERVLAFSSTDLARSGVKVQVGRADVAAAEIRSSFTHSATLVVTLHDRREVRFGDVQPADASVLVQLIRGFATSAGAGSGWRFNPPPGWPVPPAGWMPPPGWRHLPPPGRQLLPTGSSGCPLRHRPLPMVAAAALT